MKHWILIVSVVAVVVAGCSARADSTPDPTATRPAAQSTSESPGETDNPTPDASSTPLPDQAPQTVSTEDANAGSSSAEHPLIVSFSASPDAVDPGDEVRLTWETRADGVTICPVERGGPLGECLTLPASGTWDLTTHDLDRDYTEYILFAEAGDVSDQQSAIVTIRCPTAWFFEDAPQGCPYAAVHSQGALQPYEHGFMVWVGSMDTIIVLYSDADRSPRWEQFVDNWDSSMPESDPDLIPPPGLLQPVRGFGLVWRGAEGVVLKPRDRLGWASGPEVSFDTAFQCDSTPKYNTCYLQDTRGVTVLEPEGSDWYPYEGSD